MIIEQYLPARWSAKCTINSTPFKTEFQAFGDNAIEAMNTCFDKMIGLQKDHLPSELERMKKFHEERAETFANMDDEQINYPVDFTN